MTERSTTNPAKMTVDITRIDPEILYDAVSDLIDSLSKYPIEVKAAALHTARDSFPVPFDVIEVESK